MGKGQDSDEEENEWEAAVDREEDDDETELSGEGGSMGSGPVGVQHEGSERVQQQQGQSRSIRPRQPPAWLND